MTIPSLDPYEITVFFRNFLNGDVSLIEYNLFDNLKIFTIIFEVFSTFQEKLMLTIIFKLWYYVVVNGHLK